jgi:hypothetical protein
MRAEKEEAALKITKSKGVHWHKRNFKWVVTFWFNGKDRNLGYFDDHTGAVAVYSSYKHDRVRTSRTYDRPGPGPRPKISPKRPSRARGGCVCGLWGLWG